MSYPTRADGLGKYGKQDLWLNNPQGLIRREIQPNNVRSITLDLSRPVIDSKEGVSKTPLNSSTETSPSGVVERQFNEISIICLHPVKWVLPLLARIDLGEMAIKRYLVFSKAPVLLEPHHQIVLSRTLVGGVTPLQRYSRYILQLQPTGLKWARARLKVLSRKKSFTNHIYI